MAGVLSLVRFLRMLAAQVAILGLRALVRPRLAASMISSTKERVETLGVRALPRLAASIISRTREIALQPEGIAHPVYLRWRTTDANVYRQIFIDRNYRTDLGFTPRTIIDAGAHVGFASVYFANRFPAAKIVAVEPMPANYELLCRNVAPYPNIEPVRAALRGECGTVALDPLTQETWSFRMIPGDGIPAIDMRTLLELSGFDSVDLFKIDIEGSERELFANPDWLSLVKAIEIELHDQWVPRCGENFRRATEARFQRFQVGELAVAIAA